jgi:hypothetical protein
MLLRPATLRNIQPRMMGINLAGNNQVHRMDAMTVSRNGTGREINRSPEGSSAHLRRFISARSKDVRPASRAGRQHYGLCVVTSELLRPVNPFSSMLVAP